MWYTEPEIPRNPDPLTVPGDFHGAGGACHQRLLQGFLHHLFAGFGAWWMFRHKFGEVVPPVALIAGLLLVFFGAVAPKALVYPHRWWMALAEKLAWVMTRVILAIVFFLVLMPIGVLRRLTGADPLRRRSRVTGSSWMPYSARHLDARHYEKSF